MQTKRTCFFSGIELPFPSPQVEAISFKVRSRHVEGNPFSCNICLVGGSSTRSKTLLGTKQDVIELFQGLTIAGDHGQFGKDSRADGIRQYGVTERGGSLLGSRVGLSPLQEIDDLLGLDAVLH